MWIAAGLGVRGGRTCPVQLTPRALPVATTEQTPVTMDDVIGHSGEGSGVEDHEDIGSGSGFGNDSGSGGGDFDDYDYDCGEGGPCLVE